MAEALQQPAKPASAPPKAVLKFKYRVVEGKHATGEKDEAGEMVYARAGSIIIMTDAEAKRFPGKFEKVAEPVKVEDKPAEQAK